MAEYVACLRAALMDVCPCHGEPWKVEQIGRGTRRLCRVKIRERRQRYTEANREAIRRRQRELYPQRAETVRARASRWREENGPAGSAYASWKAMLHRCTCESHKDWRYYGGIGVTVCDRWAPKAGGSFANFLEDMGDRPEGKTLDRIDPYGNYEPENCRWATPLEQRANRRPELREAVA